MAPPPPNGEEDITPEAATELLLPEGNPEKPENTLLQKMNALFLRFLATPTATPIQLLTFNPDDSEADVEGWCRITEIFVNSRNIEGTELLLLLTHALKGRAAACLTKLQASQLTWQHIKELLLSKFAKPVQDYFDNILRFHIKPKETASEAATRLWQLVECIPRLQMPEDVMTGFVISVLSQKDKLLRRELNSHVLATRAHLFRLLNGISLKRRSDNNCQLKTKRTLTNNPCFAGACHGCGTIGHKIQNCRKRSKQTVTSQRTDKTEKDTTKMSSVTCFVCGQRGHVASMCPDKKLSPLVAKEVHYKPTSQLNTSLDRAQDDIVTEREEGKRTETCEMSVGP